jgi:peptidoglycan/xylan/chitin deacetylase (PgdA/CDA1 family)
MNRRRSRLPLVLLGAVAIVLGVGLGVVASSPGSGILGQPASPSAPVGGSLTAYRSGDPASGASSGVGPSVAPSGGASAGPSAAVGPSGSGSGAQPTSSPSGSAQASAGSGGSVNPSPATDTGKPARAVHNGSRSKPVVALTFDDGYNPTALRQILAVLKKENITATFFPYGWAVDKDPDGWHMVVAAGYPIGNHTLTHTVLTTETPEQEYQEMVRGRATIDLYSGGTSVNLMRPPGGKYDAVTAREVAKAGYPIMVLWDVDTLDWKGPSPDVIFHRAIKGTNGSIVLMHAGPVNTPKALPRIIANYRARGFTFVTVPQLLGVS